jgi:D-beta-D-heptose 7-phosphate kinase/D-beta-D-heptose 1-phosphate adenosyltransferase
MSSPYDFAKVRALCIGDLMLDRFISGKVDRISPESPVPVILIRNIDSIPGGAANVARNISALGGHCTLVGVIGEDRVGMELMELLSKSGAITTLPVVDDSRPTTEKTRFVAQGQQLLRADQEQTVLVSTKAESDIISRVRDVIDNHDVVILSDYAKGALSNRVIAEVIALAHKNGVPVVVDPKSEKLARYAGATIITPNIAETLLASGIDPTEQEGAERAGAEILASADFGAVLVTRAQRGLSLIQPGEEPLHVTASAREVFDVSGAGDTVVATLSLCIGAGLQLVEAATTANAAAGIVVGKRGTATISSSELHAELRRLAEIGLSRPVEKLLSFETALAQRETWQRDGLSVGFTNGCFDILHIGHVRLLEFARSQCDRLIVAINSDASVSRIKGPSRPINSEVDRGQLLSALGAVDQVVIFEEDTPAMLIEAFEPDVLVKGSDYALDAIVGADVVKLRGGKVLTFDLVPGRSTTAVIARAAMPAVPTS